MLRKVPLIVILGSTGTGKTKLSLELAERFGGEIISADSMQVYANLDIVTAKATREEQARARHHLLDVATPAEPFTVLHFRNAALPILENLLAQSKCPIVVGGTNYYIESLLWDILVSPPASESAPQAEVKHADRKSLCATAATSASSAAALQSGNAENVENPTFLSAAVLSSMSSELLHHHLGKIDPASAQRIHPNNKRKIMRAITVYQESGQTLTSIFQQQRQQPGANRLGGPLRYPHTILFWLRCNQDVLNERLDKRVDSMLEQGLLREIRAFHEQHMSDKSAENPYTKGVLQTIGFKEFIPYLEQYNAANDLKIEEYLRQNAYRLPAKELLKPKATNTNKTKTTTTEENSINVAPNSLSPPGLDVLSACLDELKLVTRRYSKKQIKWINNRFLGSKDRQVPDLYELDTSNVSTWEELVFRRAATVIECYKEGSVCELEPMQKREHPGAGLDEETSNFCAICQRHFIGEYQWGLHLKSNKHKKRKEGQRKQIKLAAESASKQSEMAENVVETVETVETETDTATQTKD